RSPETAGAASPRQVDAALSRRHTVLLNLMEMKKIDEAEYDQADTTPFVVGQTIQPRPPDREGFGPVQRADIGTEYFRDYVVQQLKQHGFSEAELFGGGLR